MRALFLLSAAGLLALSSSAAAPRVPSLALRLGAGETVVAIGKEAPPVVVFAAEELSRLLGRALGAKEPLPVVRGKAPGGKKAIFLGDTEAARAAGVEARKMGRDEYRIRLVKDGLVIAGYDDETVDPAGKWKTVHFERGTLNGVYGFLEKFAGARFYFPGRLGTIIPVQRRLEIPGKTDLMVRPNFVERTFDVQGKVPEELLGDDSEPGFAQDAEGYVRLWRLRVKEGSFHFPCCHGQENHLFRLEYKVADYPELYALQKDGTRNDKWLCQTNPKVWDLMFDRLRRRRNGEKSKWGDGYWQPHGTDRVTGITYNDIMPTDAMTVFCCLCDECQKAYVDKSYKHYNFMRDLVWGKTVEYANRIAAAGFKNEYVTQMAFPPYRMDPPSFDIPTNVEVSVGCEALWTECCEKVHEEQVNDVVAWQKKLGRRVYLWLWPGNIFKLFKYGGAPSITPRSFDRLFRRIAPLTHGAMLEAHCENFLDYAFNMYFYSQYAWEEKVDVNAVLDEQNKTLFGPAAKEMAQVLAAFEKKFIYGASQWRYYIYDLPQATTESQGRKSLAEVYDKGFCTQMTALFDAAEKKAKNDELVRSRIALFRKHLLDRVVAYGRGTK